MRAFLVSLGAIATIAVVGGALFVYSGIYNVAADDPHWDLTSRLLQEMRVRSLERRARQVSTVPSLDDPQLIAKGAGQYAAMCVNCHLAPGLPANELSKGLYPTPPELSRNRLDPRVAFTVIKHGIKMSGMPAWGGHHGDEQVWSLVAFVAKLPGMTPQQYRDLVRSPAADAAAAMASHDMGTMMPSNPGAKDGTSQPHGPPGHHGSGATTGERASDAATGAEMPAAHRAAPASATR